MLDHGAITPTFRDMTRQHSCRSLSVDHAGVVVALRRHVVWALAATHDDT